MKKTFKILIVLSLITTINTLNVYGLEGNSSTDEQVIKDIYDIKIKQRSINEQIAQIDKTIESKKTYTNNINETEVIQLSFIDDSSLKNDNDILKSTLDEEIKGLESLKTKLNGDILNLNEEEAKVKSDINETFSYGCWPVPGFEDISSPFGYRIHPISKEKKLHKGIDIPASYGTDIVATDYGIVTFSGVQNGYGNVVYLEHFDGKTSIYGHNSENLVKEGDIISKGQTIAKIGSTGKSTGNHVHFEISLNGELKNPLDITIK
jgi:murein DD-endopeptidase MepM/ murein hydrolase activator NlpD